jgi:predicted DCC family thiol-disulfide oxidoreductase YuxK
MIREQRESQMAAWRIKVLIDGACPLCRREAAFWRKLDRGRGRIATEDVSASDFDPAQYGLTREQVMEQIHGILPSDDVVRGMDVFRRAYQAVGWGWLAAPTAWPIIEPLFDRAYRWFARNRLRIIGRAVTCEGTCSHRLMGRSSKNEYTNTRGFEKCQ